jgi:hypothetical protein
MSYKCAPPGVGLGTRPTYAKIPNATNPANGEVQLVSVRVPAAWWVKLTLSHVTVTAATYY